ncbi:MAG: winged helix-turn-helix domain-containing tetratricopeptide repeat protein [Pyrinomonadaceae bacterium]
MKELSESRIYEFDEFRLDAKSHRLFRRESNELVPLTPKAVELLLVLVESKGRILSKDELLDTIWGNSFVEESNLSQTIFVLRKTLGENTKEPRFILTAPNRGYQFIAQVKEINSEDKILEESFLSENQPPKISDFGLQIPNPKSEIRNPKSLWLAVPIVLLLAFGIYWFYPTAKPVTVREIKSIAVLPFEDSSAGQTEKYLGVSLADALVNKFSGLKQITVRPTRTVSKYADSRSEASVIGRELQVDAVLDGRIQRVGERIRVSVQLVRTSDNAAIWTENFDDQFTNFFAMQDSISQKVVQSLALKMNEKERERFNRQGTENAEAYQEYLRGRYFWNKRTGVDLKKAIEYFEQATQKDQNFALAYAGLADCYILLPEYGAATTQESFSKAEYAIEKALELDDQSVEVYTALGYKQAFYDWDWKSAEQSFKRSLELNPNYATAHQWYAEYLAELGKFDEAHNQFALAMQIDPTSPIIINSDAHVYFIERKYDQSIAQLQKCIELDPNFGFCYSNLAFAYEEKEMFADAMAAHIKAITLWNEPRDAVVELEQAFAKNGIKGFWQTRLEQFKTYPHLKNYPAESQAFCYAKLGDKEHALEWLNLSFQQRERYLTTVRLSPVFDLLRDEPRFQELRRQMGL